MRFLKAILATLCTLSLAVGLSACSVATGGAGVQTAFDAACKARQPAYNAFLTYAVVKQVKEATVQKVASANEQAIAVCANPPADLASALSVVTSVALEIALARQEVNRSRPAVAAAGG